MPLSVSFPFPGRARRNACPSLAHAVLLVAVLLLPRIAAAQLLYGSLVGNVADSSGGAIADAKIRILSPATNESREAVTNAYGGYSFANLTASEYTLTVTASGFQTFVSNGVRVSINSTVRVDATLQVGTVTEQMTVTFFSGYIPDRWILGGTGPNAVWFDPAAYAPVTQARLGTSGLLALRGPGLINLDFGLFRDFALTERFHLQFRGESFNFTNTPHWALPSANISNATFNANGTIANLGGFGSITNTDAGNLGRAQLDERTFRFGLRLSF
jgi:hypothetical protein